MAYKLGCGPFPTWLGGIQTNDFQTAEKLRKKKILSEKQLTQQGYVMYSIFKCRQGRTENLVKRGQ